VDYFAKVNSKYEQVEVFLQCSNDFDQISTMRTIEDLLKKTCNDVPIIKLKKFVKDTPPTGMVILYCYVLCIYAMFLLHVHYMWNSRDINCLLSIANCSTVLNVVYVKALLCVIYLPCALYCRFSRTPRAFFIAQAGQCFK